MLVGRDPEIAQIAAAVEGARDGRGSALVIRAEPGMGKTALLLHATEIAEDMLVLRARGVEGESQLPFAAFDELVHPILHLRDRLPSAQSSALAQALALENEGPAAPASRFAIGAALIGLLGGAAEDQPVLVLVDDAQWLDQPSLEAILFAARRLRADGVAVLIATRPEGRPGANNELPVITLGPLEQDAAVELLRAQHGSAIARPVAQSLATSSGGVPLALLEVPAGLSGAQLAGREPIDRPLKPGSSLETALTARLERLPEETRRALAIAAAGDTRRGSVVMAALAHAGLSLDAVAPAEADGLVSLQRGAIVFRHPLLRAAAYHAVSPAERREAHAAIAASLTEDDPQRAWQQAAAAVGPDDDVAAALEQAALAATLRGGPVPAAHAHLRAAELSTEPGQRVLRTLTAALSMLAAGELDQADALLDQVEGMEGADAVGGMLRTGRGQIALRRGHAAMARGFLGGEGDAAERRDDPLTAAAVWLTVVVAALTGRDADGAVEAAERARRLSLGRDETLHTLATGLAGAAYLAAGDPARGLNLLTQAEPGLGHIDPLGPASDLLALIGHAFVWIDDDVRAHRILSRIVERARDAGAVGALPYPLAGLAQLEWSRGRWRLGQSYADEAVELGDEAGQAAALIMALSTRAWGASGRGDEAAARADAERAFALAAETGSLSLTLVARWALALLELCAGRADAAIEQLDLLRAEALPGHLTWVPELVEAYAAAGRDEDARAVLDDYAARPAAGLPLPLLERCRALLAPAAEMAAHFEAALAAHADIVLPFDEARTRLLYGERLRAEDRRDEARTVLREAHAAFEELGASGWAERASRQLRAAGGHAPRVDARLADELTPSELQVALLVAEGRTNREVAAAIFLSPKTVEHYLSQIYRKLGIKRRTELTRLLAGELPPPEAEAA